MLKDTDPYFVEEEFSDTDLNYRRFRMNYFAAKGLMARVQLWGGDKEKAAATAKEVIAEGQAEGAEFFPFVTNSEATSSNPDRVFYSEYCSEPIILPGKNYMRICLLRHSSRPVFSP